MHQWSAAESAFNDQQKIIDEQAEISRMQKLEIEDKKNRIDELKEDLEEIKSEWENTCERERYAYEIYRELGLHNDEMEKELKEFKGAADGYYRRIYNIFRSDK
mgnify:CR=1 FL=1